MAVDVYTPGNFFRIYLGTDAEPPVYAPACGINAVEVNLEVPVVEAPARDCATEFAEPIMARSPGIPTWSITGSGLYVDGMYELTHAALTGGESRYWQVKNSAGAIWAGKWVGTALGLSAQTTSKEFVEVSLSLVSDGLITYTPA